jgi:hypothetical protein
LSTPKSALDKKRFTERMSDPGPFGNPDGSRAAIEEVLEGFVNFGSPLVWGGLAMRDDDRKARVIVGRKGSGKTVYLRRLQAAAVKEDSLYADDIQQRVPSTESIVRFCQLFEGSIVDEKWTNLWRCAILSSVVSHLLNVSSLTNLIPPGIVSDLKKEFEKILPIYKAPVTAYSQITQIIETNHTANMVRTFFNNPLWSALEWMIGEALKHCPPLCFFIDAVDEEFEHAPMYWLKTKEMGVEVVKVSYYGNLRLQNQMGSFTLSRTPFSCLEDYVSNCRDSGTPLHKIILSTDLAKTALADLDLMGINHSRIFPEILGCALASKMRVLLQS